jgi:hypothetical protein
MAARKSKETPVRAALLVDSYLRAGVQDRIGAVKQTHRSFFAGSLQGLFVDSLDLDAALECEYPSDNRWDYLLGHSGTSQVVGVEPHSARAGEITTVVRKRKAALRQLAAHFKPGARVSKWIWVASGRVQFADTERVRRQLDQNGIKFSGAHQLAKFL